MMKSVNHNSLIFVHDITGILIFYFSKVYIHTWWVLSPRHYPPPFLMEGGGVIWARTQWQGCLGCFQYIYLVACYYIHENFILFVGYSWYVDIWDMSCFICVHAWLCRWRPNFCFLISSAFVLNFIIWLSILFFPL